MKRIALLATIFLLLYAESSACLNYYVLDSSGRKHMHEGEAPTNIYISPKWDIEQLKDLEKELRTVAVKEKFKYISNYAASLIKLGRFKAAIPILEKLLVDHPNEYEVNANLAVAYELNGQIDQAFKYLQKAIKINPRAHDNSEWFHLSILKAAITLRDKSGSPRDMDVLKIRNEKSKNTGYHISYQLHERIPLTKSPNNLLSKVIEESADYYKANISIEWAVELYAMAIGYTSDSATERSLWEKINSSRLKLLEFKRQGKTGSVGKYLYTSAWKKPVSQRIQQWRNYKPYYYNGEIITAF